MKQKITPPKTIIRPKFLITTGLGIVIVASLTLAYKSTFSNFKTTKKTEKFGLKSSNNRAQKFNIDSNRDTVIIFETGSVIKIKKNSFEDKNGQPIAGEVTLHYREFHSVGETLLAGIPMEYDSSGTNYHFESAGMFEIAADFKKEPIFLKKQSTIEVELVTANSDATKFNQYYLENKDEKWQFLHKDIVSIVNPIDSIQVEKTNIASSKFVKPSILNSKNKQFTIEVQKDKFPELEVFKNIIFEVPTTTKNYDEKKTKKKWLDVELKRIDQTRNYEITFLGTNEKYAIIAYPVVDTSNYEASLAFFNQLNNSYQNQKNEKQTRKESSLEAQEEVYTNALNNYREFLKSSEGIYSDSTALFSMAQKRYDKVNDLVLRAFQVRQFGIYNSDCPSNLPQGMLIAAIFKDESGNVLRPSNFFLIEKGKNAVYTLYDQSKISFNPNASNKFIIISNGILSWVSDDEFKEVNKEDKTFTFHVKTVKKVNYKSSDINELI
jgi:hypothetical protein